MLARRLPGARLPTLQPLQDRSELLHRAKEQGQGHQGVRVREGRYGAALRVGIGVGVGMGLGVGRV